MNSKREPLKIAFSTQKGGAGKTSLTVLTASYLHYVKNHNVVIIDCDYPQHSITDMRQRDLKLIQDDDFYNRMAYKQFTASDKKAYAVMESTPEYALEDAQNAAEQLQPDFIFFDLPGTINNHEVIEILSRMDYIIVPVSADRLVVESSLQFGLAIQEELINVGKSTIKGIHFLWNMVDGREKTELYDVYEQVIKHFGFSFLKTYIPDTKRFRKEQSTQHKALFRSTLFPVDNILLKGSNIDSLVDELLEILQ
ncbi:MAG: ParA family protein [Bacteroidales bacterium]|jgi:cellulose biosynthesis protein BcsQ|nr:ParA family protein [Bacteroidales bacterium]